VCLRFDAAAAEHAYSHGLFAGVIEEGRLADTGFTQDHQGGAARRSSAVEQFSDPGALLISPVDHVLDRTPLAVTADSGQIAGAMAAAAKRWWNRSQ
jgi:hypothetical protein